MKKIEKLVLAEAHRQNDNIELIASENFTSKRIRDLCGSVLTNKYAEGYPNKRYYGGCRYIDKIEQHAIQECCKLFHCKFANVQPHSGSQANFAAYHALLPKGGKILSLVLNDGGHLTHGSPVSFSGQSYNFVHYGLDGTGHIDYDKLLEVAEREKPDVILAGYSAYPYAIEFNKIKQVCRIVNCKFMVDMAHIAGLVAAGYHSNPVLYADVVTSTTHKTLRGPRGGIILTNDEELAKRINSSVFPYAQGGPLEHIIAAKGACFEEAQTESFKRYIKQVIANTYLAADTFRRKFKQKWNEYSCTFTDNHLFLLNTMKSYGISGREAQERLEKINITVNKNMIPGDTLSPKDTSGIRVGFAAVTTRGCTKQDVVKIVNIIDEYLSNSCSISSAKAKVAEITKKWKRIEEI